MACLCPSPLQLRFRACALGGGTDSSSTGNSNGTAMQQPPLLADLSAVLAARGVELPSGAVPGLLGPLWGVHVQVGQWLQLDLEASYNSCSGGGCEQPATGQPPPTRILVTLSATDVLCSAAEQQQHTGTPKAAAARQLQETGPEGLIDAGLCIAGTHSRVPFTLHGDAVERHMLGVLMAQPGLYLFSVADVVRETDSSRLYFTQDRLAVLASW
jgi:hypothetical protein